MACWTEEEIAGDENINRDTVNEAVSRISADPPKSAKVLSDFADSDFYVPITATSTSPNPSMPAEMPSSISPGSVQDREP